MGSRDEEYRAPAHPLEVVMTSRQPRTGSALELNQSSALSPTSMARRRKPPTASRSAILDGRTTSWLPRGACR